MKEPIYLRTVYNYHFSSKVHYIFHSVPGRYSDVDIDNEVKTVILPYDYVNICRIDKISRAEFCVGLARENLEQARTLQTLKLRAWHASNAQYWIEQYRKELYKR